MTLQITIPASFYHGLGWGEMKAARASGIAENN
jgi:hypothetical protein